jgi:hypothetical protein
LPGYVHENQHDFLTDKGIAIMVNPEILQIKVYFCATNERNTP